MALKVEVDKPSAGKATVSGGDPGTAYTVTLVAHHADMDDSAGVDIDITTAKTKTAPVTAPKVDSTTADGGVVSWTASATAGATYTATVKLKS